MPNFIPLAFIVPEVIGSDLQKDGHRSLTRRVFSLEGFRTLKKHNKDKKTQTQKNICLFVYMNKARQRRVHLSIYKQVRTPYTAAVAVTLGGFVMTNAIRWSETFVANCANSLTNLMDRHSLVCFLTF